MATTKLWHISGRIEDVIDYAENPEKTCPIPDLEDLWNAARYAERPEATADGQYVTAINCTRETAVRQMILTKQQFRKTDGFIAWHGYQSFKPGEISPELCHKIGVLTAKAMWGDRFQIIVTTHLDKEHLHNHFVFNSVSFVDGKKYNYSKRELNRLREYSDYYCEYYHLSVVPVPHKAPSRPAYFDEKDGKPTRYNVYREDIREAFQNSCTLQAAEAYLRRLGYITDFSDRVHYRIRLPQYQHFTRLDTLDSHWTPERLSRMLSWKPGVKAVVRWQTDVPEHLRHAHQPHQRPSHIYRLYLYYCYQLGILPKKTEYKPNSPFLREELRKLDQYDRETRFLGETGIEIMDELQAFIAEKQEALDQLTAERTSIQNKMRRADPEAKESLRQQKTEKTESITTLREQLKLAKSVEARSFHMQETLDLVYDNEVRHRQQNQTRSKQHKQLTHER